MRWKNFLILCGSCVEPLLVLDSVVWFEYSELVLLLDPICPLSELSSISLINDGWGVDILMHWESCLAAEEEELDG